MSTSRRLFNIQIARAIAALMVVVEHAREQTVSHPIDGMPSLWLPGGSTWSSGVDIFFIISGLIMVYTNRDRFENARNIPTFIWHRIARVAPTYWLFTIGMILSSIVFKDSVRNGPGDAWHVISSFLFIPAPRPDGELHPVLGLGWTLNYEFEFYICFSLALAFPRRIGLIGLTVALAVLSSLHSVATSPALQFWSDPIILEFLLGVGLGLLLIGGQQIGTLPALALAIVGYVLLFAFHRAEAGELRTIITGIPSAMIVASLALSSQRAWPKLLTKIGDASYAMYLCHPFCLNIATILWKRLHLPPNNILFFCLEIVLSLVAALCIYEFVEQPLINFILGRSRGKAATPEMPSSEGPRTAQDRVST
jgi:peptidoglycan/LPS O-acetylase OafA/YrhL